jgi:hypothetical protein
MSKFFDKVTANRNAGMDRKTAMRAARQSDPQGFRAWLESHNSQHGRSLAGYDAAPRVATA